MISVEGLDKVTELPAPALGLLPAVHDSTVSMFTGTSVVYGTSASGGQTITIRAADLPSPQASQVLQVSGGAATIPAVNSWPAQVVPMGSFVGSDGRFWFPVRRHKATNSYYPEIFERTLYTFSFTAYSLPANIWWNHNRAFDFRMFNNNTDAVWNVVYEIGETQAQASPAPVGPNLLGYVWREPLIDEQVHITDIKTTHLFGVSLYRKVDGGTTTWMGNVKRYGRTLAALAAQLPTGTSFVLRARLSCFDTINAIADPRGYVAYYNFDPAEKEK